MGTSRPRQDVPDKGWDPLAPEGVERGPARAVISLRRTPWEASSGSGAVPGQGCRCGAEGAKRGSPRSSNVGGRGPCGRGPVLAGSAGAKILASGPVKKCGTPQIGVHSVRSRAYCGADGPVGLGQSTARPQTTAEAVLPFAFCRPEALLLMNLEQG